MFITLITSFCCLNFAQIDLDSLRSAASNETNDTSRATILYQLAMEVMWTEQSEGLSIQQQLSQIGNDQDDERVKGLANKIMAYHHHYNTGEPDSAKISYDLAKENFKALGDLDEVAYLQEYAARAYLEQGNNAVAYLEFEKAIPLYTQAGDVLGVGNTYNTLAAILSDQGDHIKAIQQYRMAIKAYSIDSSMIDIAIVKMNIGAMYIKTGDYDEGLKLYNESLIIRRKEGDLFGMAYVYNNMSQVFKNSGELEKAIACIDSSYVIRDSIGDIAGTVNNYINYGGVYFRWGKYQKAEEYFNLAYEMASEAREYEDLITININLGMLNGIQGNLKKAEGYFVESLEGSEYAGIIEAQLSSHDGLTQVYEGLGDYKSALFHFRSYVALSDSMSNKAKIREMSKISAELKFENKIKADSLENKVIQSELDRANLEQESTAQQNRLIILIALISAISLGAIILVLARNNRRKKRDNEIIRQQKAEVDQKREEIEVQKEALEEKNKEILDSIKYAKRLQKAILPSDESVASLLSNSFVYYLPKDIVAGDFYWVEKVGNKTFVAAADCTGHGVPGAMVSVVCSNALNKAVIEERIEDPGKILDRVTDLVIARFESAEHDVKDGMDIALCVLEGNKVHYAGANNPLWIFRNSESIIEQHKATKQPVGQYELRKAFESHSFTLEKDDVIYLFSDGYADQFGGPKGKKFKYSNLKTLLEQIASKEMSTQRLILDETLTEWRGELEQIDDICIIGIRM